MEKTIAICETFALGDEPRAFRDVCFQSCLFEGGNVALDDNMTMRGIDATNCNFVVVSEGSRVFHTSVFADCTVLDSRFDGVTFFIGEDTARKLREASDCNVEFLIGADPVLSTKEELLRLRAENAILKNDLRFKNLGNKL